MTNKARFIIAVASLVAFGCLMIPTTSSYEKTLGEAEISEPDPVSLITHSQDTWIRALEWCESNGKIEAINPVDLDNTPSYGAFQFKPSTFEHFKSVYGVEGELMDRDVQYLLVVHMVLDRDSIRWDMQFPACVRKLGYPPRG